MTKQSNPDRLHHVDRDTFRAIAQQPGINTETLRTGTQDTVRSLERLEAAGLITGIGAGETTTWAVDNHLHHWAANRFDEADRFTIETMADTMRAFDAYAREVMNYRPPAGKPGHPVQEWQTEVISGGTRLGYDDWCKSRTTADIVERINAGEVVTGTFGTGGIKLTDSQPRSGADETVQERYDRLRGAGYGQAGGSSGDHMIRLATLIADGYAGTPWSAFRNGIKCTDHSAAGTTKA